MGHEEPHLVCLTTIAEVVRSLAEERSKNPPQCLRFSHFFQNSFECMHYSPGLLSEKKEKSGAVN